MFCLNIFEQLIGFYKLKTIIPLTLIASESIAQEAEGRMGHDLEAIQARGTIVRYQWFLKTLLFYCKYIFLLALTARHIAYKCLIKLALKHLINKMIKPLSHLRLSII